MVKVGIVGGTGYTGAELLRLLARHPQARLQVLTSRQEAGKRVDAVLPHLRGVVDLEFSAPGTAALAKCDAVFFATPHATAMTLVPGVLKQGAKVLDLSADFRLKDAALWERWYGQPHAAPKLLAEAVYGLPEANRDEIRKAKLVACPGCYPTSVLLGFMPLVEKQLVDPGSLIADCKSGVTGAGRELKLGSMFSEASDSMKAYGLGGHRHGAEIEQGLSQLAGAPAPLTFVPHLVPLNRGIHATLYATLAKDVDVQELYAKRYAKEPFVDVMPSGEHPETRSVRGTNTCRIAVHRPGHGRRVVILSAIDNLAKGAAGQAVQCFNLMFGLKETDGLEQVATWP